MLIFPLCKGLLTLFICVFIYCFSGTVVSAIPALLPPITAIPTFHLWSHQTLKISFDAIIKNKQKAKKEKRLIQKYVVRVKLWKQLKVHVWICSMKFWYVNVQQPTCPLICLSCSPLFPGLVCQRGMLYHHCSSFCRRSCAALSAPQPCADECAEGCNCPEGKFYEETLHFCVPM